MELTSAAERYDARKGDWVEVPNTTVDWCRISCGVSMVHNLPGDPEAFIRHVVGPRPINNKISKEAFIIWSDVCYGNRSNGQNIYNYIVAHPTWGPVLKTNERKNPNSLSTIQVWIWEVDHSNIELQALVKSNNKFPPLPVIDK